MEAVFDRNWDPRSKQLATTSEEWIIENSKLWKWVMEPLDLDWSFPVKKAQFKRRYRVGTRSLVINSTMSNPGGASSNLSFSILWKIFLVL